MSSEINPEDSYTLRNRARIYYDKKDFDKAKDLNKK
jgi:hypothetical protein